MSHMSSLYMVAKYGYIATTTIKSGVETLLWTKKIGNKLWKYSPFNTVKAERKVIVMRYDEQDNVTILD